jgi:hypothetical protein
MPASTTIVPAGPVVTPSLAAAIAGLQSVGLSWFDDNPYAWEGGETFAGPITPWDIVKISGFKFLGEITGQVGTKIDAKSGVNQNSLDITASGQDNMPFDVKLWLPTPADLYSFATMLPIIFKISSNRQPVEILHPSLIVFNIGTGPSNQFYLREVGTIVRPTRGEPASVSLKFLPFKNQTTGSAQGIPTMTLPQSAGAGAGGQTTPPAPASPGSQIAPRPGEQGTT